MAENDIISEHMAEMTDQEWLAFYVEKASMQAYRYARSTLSNIALPVGHDLYPEIENALYNAELNRQWEKHRLPEESWPYRSADSR